MRPRSCLVFKPSWVMRGARKPSVAGFRPRKAFFERRWCCRYTSHNTVRCFSSDSFCFCWWSCCYQPWILSASFCLNRSLPLLATLPFIMDTQLLESILYVYPVSLAVGLLASNLYSYLHQSANVVVKSRRFVNNVLWYTQVLLCCSLVRTRTFPGDRY